MTWIPTGFLFHSRAFAFISPTVDPSELLAPSRRGGFRVHLGSRATRRILRAACRLRNWTRRPSICNPC